MAVVLPAPFGPRMPVTAPRAALSVSPSTAVVWPYRLISLLISTAGGCGTVLTHASLRRPECPLCDAGHLGSLPGSSVRSAAVSMTCARLGKTLPSRTSRVSASGSSFDATWPSYLLFVVKAQVGPAEKGPNGRG